MEAKKEERAVKGTMVLDVVKAINATGEKQWEQMLSKQALELTRQKILPSNWYPYGPFMECLKKVFEVFGGNDPQVAKEWGKMNGRRVFETVYKNLIAAGQPEASLKKLEVMGVRAFAKGTHVSSVKLDENHYQIKFYDTDPDSRIIIFLIEGWIEALLEITGGKVPKVELIQKQWEDAPQTVMDVTWE